MKKLLFEGLLLNYGTWALVTGKLGVESGTSRRIEAHEAQVNRVLFDHNPHEFAQANRGPLHHQHL